MLALLDGLACRRLKLDPCVRSTATFAAASFRSAQACAWLRSSRHWNSDTRSCRARASASACISLPSCMPSRRTSQRKAVNSRITRSSVSMPAGGEDLAILRQDAGVECQLLLLLSFRNDSAEQGDERSDRCPDRRGCSRRAVSYRVPNGEGHATRPAYDDGHGVERQGSGGMEVAQDPGAGACRALISRST